MLPGWCCIANRHIGARERRQLIPHVRFQVPPESQLKSGFACAGLLCRLGKINDSLQHLQFDLCFGGKRGCWACHMHCASSGVQEVVV